jgi:hypothetical protein
MEEIESIRIRIGNNYNSDIKLTLYKVNNNKRTIKTDKPNLYNDEDFGFSYRNKTNSYIIDEYLSNSIIGVVSGIVSYEIIQNPWSEITPKPRSFGFDPYYLNNGSIVYIKWINEYIHAGGKEWSDDKGNELDVPTSGEESKYYINKFVNIYNVDVSESFVLNKYNEIIEENGTNGNQFSGNFDDLDIIETIITIWKSQIGGDEYELELCNPSNEFCNIIEYKSPLKDIEVETPIPPSSSGSISNNSNKLKLKLSCIEDGITIKAKEDIRTFFIYIDKLPKPYLDKYDELRDLDNIYEESDYQGPEIESLILEGIEVILFDNTELNRDGSVGNSSGKVATNGSNVIKPNKPVSTTKVKLSNDLDKVRNSNVIKKQSTGGGEYRNIDNDIVAPSGDKIKAINIIKSINEFISDVLDPFSTYLKANHPDLYKNWYITSATRGYVPKGGSLRSQHLKGQAIDSQILEYKGDVIANNIKLLNAILSWYESNPVGYTQILFETRHNKSGRISCWIHWAYKRGDNRLDLRRFKNDGTLSSNANVSGEYVKSGITFNDLKLNDT